MGIPGFDQRTVRVDVAGVHVAVGGSGPVLLLHGFPQTHLAWRHVAPALAEDFRVVCPDLPGYGASAAPAGGDLPEQYAKRRTAATMVALMRELGHDRFSVVGHDRGALVAFRAALDHPEVVEHLGVLDVIPTVDNWDAMTGAAGVFAFHLYLLAQPGDLPERMISADPDAFFGHFLDTWVAAPGALETGARAAYLEAAARPRAIHAVCQDYRASARRRRRARPGGPRRPPAPGHARAGHVAGPRGRRPAVRPCRGLVALGAGPADPGRVLRPLPARGAPR